MTTKAVRRQRGKSKEPPSVIGWSEWVALPELGVSKINAKIDTGARTAALHAYRIKETVVDGEPGVRFSLKPLKKNPTTMVSEAPLKGYRRVRSSDGRTETRPVIQTAVELNGQRWDIEITLTRRDQMGFRLLLGRQAVKGRFLVDAGRSFVASE